MFFDPTPMGGPQGWPPARHCQSCKQPISSGQPTEELRFERDAEHGLDEMNGIYHAECARPFLSIKRALDVLGRFPF